MLKTFWWMGRLSMMAGTALFYAHYIVGSGNELSTACDAPLLGYIVTEGVLNVELVVMRSLLLIIGYSDDPSNTVRFLILFPVVLHFIESGVALFGASYLVMPSDCDPGYDPAFVLTTAILVFCVCVVSGVLFPLMFDTRVKGLAENGVTIACDPDSSVSAAGKLLRDMHSYFLVYRTGLISVMLLVFIITRGDRLIIEAVDPCGDALVIWIFAELAFYLISYTATLYYAIKSLLYPLLDWRLNSLAFLFFTLFQVFWGLLGSYLAFGKATKEDCYSKDPAISYMAAAGVVTFWVGLAAALMFMPCWLHVFKTKRHKAVQVLEEMHMVRDRKQEEMRHAGRT